jgi:hypothetical protein
MYSPGEVYNFTKEYAEKLIALDKKKPLGALSFFTPADEEAANLMKALKSNPAVNTGTAPSKDNTPKPPSTEELAAEAKSLGIDKADKMSLDELKKAIADKKQGPAPKP